MLLRSIITIDIKKKHVYICGAHTSEWMSLAPFRGVCKVVYPLKVVFHDSV